jgi:uncharacterized LabA/DUF88 family protein
MYNKDITKSVPCKIMKKTIFYVDGFNLYFGIKTSGWNNLKWLDINLLAKNLIKPDQEIVEVNYFTSRVRNAPDKEKRQITYLEALLQFSGVKIHYGKYQPNIITCYCCGHSYSSPNEKMTDVNIAVKMLIDAFQNKFDTAILISGDSDLVPPVREIKKYFKDKKVIVAFPPKRHNISLSNLADGSFIIGRKKIKDSQLPDEIIKPDGHILIRPTEWK